MKVTLTDLANLQNELTAVTAINNNNAAIEVAMENTLSRDGTAPNTMSAELDMDSNQIINLPQPATGNSPLRFQDLSDFIGGGTITPIPSGGTTGQVLSKNSNTNYDTGWTNSVTSVGLALPADLTVTNSPVTTIGTLTGAWAVTPTGTGAMVRTASPTITSPTLITPALGTPTSGVATNLTGTASGLTAGNVTTNANLTGPITSTGNATAVASQTGTGTKFVMDTSPVLITPALGTPVSGVATNLTGTASGLTAGNVTTNANLTGVITSVGNATSIASQTGTGTKFVVDNGPTLTGVPSAPTAAVDTNTTQIATTAMVLAQASASTPIIDGTGTIGTSTRFARADHIHPTDTTRQAADAQLFSNIPQNSQSVAYTLVLTDGEKHIFHPSADTTARIWTIPANASVAYPTGTAITFINQNSAGVITISITTDTMRLAGAGTTGSRTLAANGIATAIKVTSTEWIISGTGLT